MSSVVATSGKRRMNMKAKLIVGLGLLLGVVGVLQADTIFNGGSDEY